MTANTWDLVWICQVCPKYIYLDWLESVRPETSRLWESISSYVVPKMVPNASLPGTWDSGLEFGGLDPPMIPRRGMSLTTAPP